MKPLSIAEEYYSSLSSLVSLSLSFQFQCISHRKSTYGMVRPSLTNHPIPVTHLTSLIPGNSTLSAITAVVAANVVLISYIVASLRDDRAEQEARKPLESRKDR